MTSTSTALAWRTHLLGHETEPAAWLACSRALRATVPAAEREAMLREVKHCPLVSVPGLFYRALLLTVHTGESRWVREAGEAFNAWQDCPVERLWSFVTLMWGAAILAPDGAQFRGILELAKVPSLLERISARLEDSCRSLMKPARLDHQAPLERVALVVPHLVSGTHAGTRLALEHAAVLAGRGVDVRVFSAQEIENLDLCGWLGSDATAGLGAAMPETWKPCSSEASFQVKLSNAAMPVLARWQEALEALHAWKPQAVLFVGFYSPLLHRLHANWPVVAISLHAQPPIGPTDVWLHQFLDGEPRPPAWYPDATAVPVPYAFRLPPPVGRRIRGAAQKEAAARPLRMVTVGARLSLELKAPWCQRMRDLLERHPAWEWLVIGDARPCPALETPHQRIKVYGHQDNLAAVLRQCDLYVNPPRVGGGFSMLEAMAEGLAAVALAGADAGNKLGPHAMAAESEFWSQLESLLNDAALRESLGATLRQRFDTHFNLANAGPALLHALAVARQRHAARMYAHEEP